MESFAAIRARAVERKGGADAIDALMPQMRASDELAAIPDDRWLAAMTRAVFNSGFNWKVIDAKWDGFETAFHGFDPGRVAFMDEDAIDALTRDTGIVRHAGKITATRENAVFVTDLIREHGSAGRFFADWPASDQIGLMETLKKRGSRLGGNTGQYFLRHMGKDGFVLGGDVVKALIKWGAVEKPPTSKRDLAATQAAFNGWAEETGLPMAHVSRTLALSVGEED
ncbi:DNA-3-methyladenine glycosylase I [Minwuia sp.]|uniref:DNA-3-methyladenine glycosylase I n=1 Tax=Minwuia sp. TaxID=2493630 RepID=UPI003A92567C